MHRFNHMPNKFNKLKQEMESFPLSFVTMHILHSFTMYIGGPLDRCVCTYRHKLILSFLTQEMDTILKASPVTISINDSSIQPRVWTCWWQGADQAPPLVQACLRRMSQVYPNQVCIITKDNFQEYIEVPSHVLEKVKKGIITLTHFSDILRVGLLAKYGGLWLDATVYCHAPLSETLMQLPVYTCRFPASNYDFHYPSPCFWTAFILGGNKQATLYKKMWEIFLSYWEKYDAMIDYFLVDYTIALLYAKCPDIKEELDQVPLNNEQVLKLMPRINEAYDSQTLQTILMNGNFSKLSYKQPCETQTTDGQKTFYEYIVHEGL